MNTRATLLPLTLLAVSMTAQQATSATVSFEAPVSYVVGGGPRSIATADVNQDGIADVITADHEAGVSVLLDRVPPP